MKARLILSSVLLILLSFSLAAQDKGSKNPASKSSTVDSIRKGTLPTAELEATFKATLTLATLTGRWTPLTDGVMGEEKEDKYSIVSASKIGNDEWVINARIQYNKQDMIVPLPVQVKWAGDTAVLLVDKLQMPGGGTYSARVLIYGKTYAGSWKGGGHSGLLNGVIITQKP